MVFARLRDLFAAPHAGSRGRRARVDQVAPWLHIGPGLTAEGYAQLRERGVTHVVDLRAEASDDAAMMERLGFRWMRYPVRDREAPTHEQLEALLAWLEADAETNTEQALYVHCHAGLGRTPSVAMALLMQHDLSLAEAHRMVLAVRPECAPTAAQLAWLEAVEAARGIRR